MTVAMLLQIAGFGALGGALGILYFALLRRSVHALTGGGSGARFLPLLLARLGAAVLVFLAAAMTGPVALLAAAGGFVAARFFAVRRTQAGVRWT